MRDGSARSGRPRWRRGSGVGRCDRRGSRPGSAPADRAVDQPRRRGRGRVGAASGRRARQRPVPEPVRCDRTAESAPQHRAWAILPSGNQPSTATAAGSGRLGRWWWQECAAERVVPGMAAGRTPVVVGQPRRSHEVTPAERTSPDEGSRSGLGDPPTGVGLGAMGFAAQGTEVVRPGLSGTTGLPRSGVIQVEPSRPR